MAKKKQRPYYNSTMSQPEMHAQTWPDDDERPYAQPHSAQNQAGYHAHTAYQPDQQNSSQHANGYPYADTPPNAPYPPYGMHYGVPPYFAMPHLGYVTGMPHHPHAMNMGMGGMGMGMYAQNPYAHATMADAAGQYAPHNNAHAMNPNLQAMFDAAATGNQNGLLHGLQGLLGSRQNEQFILGALIGAAAVYVLGDEEIRGKIAKNVMKLYATVAGGFEEIKEQMADIRAEVEAEQQE